MRDDRGRLADILAAIDKIRTKTAAGRAAFEVDEMLQVWVLHHLQIIGEAARCLSTEFRLRNPDDVWSEAVGMRNILVHHYFEIAADVIWKVVENDLMPLREKVQKILDGGLG